MSKMLILSLLILLSPGGEQPLVEHPTLIEMNRISNQIRARAGLKPCVLDERLCRAAVGHSYYMARTGEFSHYTNRGYTQRAIDARFKGPVQENIAMGQGSVSSVMSTWEHSSGHYAAIVGGYDKVGFGLAYSSSGSPYWVAMYGKE